MHTFPQLILYSKHCAFLFHFIVYSFTKLISVFPRTEALVSILYSYSRSTHAFLQFLFSIISVVPFSFYSLSNITVALLSSFLILSSHCITISSFLYSLLSLKCHLLLSSFSTRIVATLSTLRTLYSHCSATLPFWHFLFSKCTKITSELWKNKDDETWEYQVASEYKN